MKWTAEDEKKLVELRENNVKLSEIAKILGTTIASVKHKCTRLSQKTNADTHHHPAEKTRQIREVLDLITGDVRVLETHAGHGNLTEVYSSYAKEVVSYEIDKEKCSYVNQRGYANVVCHNKDSLKELYLSIYNNQKFNVIDIDPYGFPSRYFPNVFELIDDGYMFVTLPKYGCAQINNITKLHIKSFYGFEGGDNEAFLKCCLESFKNQALRTYRSCEVINVLDLNKVYRIALRIRKENAFILCGYEHLTKSNCE